MVDWVDEFNAKVSETRGPSSRWSPPSSLPLLIPHLLLQRAACGGGLLVVVLLLLALASFPSSTGSTGSSSSRGGGTEAGVEALRVLDPLGGGVHAALRLEELELDLWGVHEYVHACACACVCGQERRDGRG